MKVWIVAELDSVFPNSGTVVGFLLMKNLQGNLSKKGVERQVK